MAVASACPEAAVLQQLVVGQMSPEEVERLAEHCERCDRCIQTMHKLQAKDTVVDALAAQATDADGRRNPAIDLLIARLKGLRPVAAVTASTTTAGDAAPPAGPGDDLYDFLAAPQVDGELGRLGEYRVLKVLGAGGMGIVFQAEDPRLKRPVALKVMKPALAASESARRRFLREAQTLAAIDHEHIVPVFQVGEDRGAPFLAMPLLKGETLEGRLRREPTLPPSEVLRIGRETAAGLAAAHAAGLIHRDVKPGNLWLEAGRGRVRLLDFGLARAAEEDMHLTQTGAIVGTPAYMAPEQARGEAVDARADLFSLGAVLYRMATGEMPFRGANTTALLMSLMLDAPRPPQELNPALPPALSRLILRLLSKNADERPPSAETLVKDLAALERPPGITREPAAAAATTIALPAPVPSVRRRRPWAYVAAIAAVLLASLGVAGWLCGATVVRIATNKGVVVIETEDADVEVTVKGQGATLIDRKTKREIEVQAGDEEIEVREKPDGLRFFTKRFTLTRGETEVVNVRLELANAEAPAVPNGKPAVAPAPEFQEVQRFVGQSTGAVGEVALSPDGSLAATGGANMVWVWDVQTGKLLRQFKGHTAPVQQMAFSEDGRRVLSVSRDGTCRVWDVQTCAEIRRFTEHHGEVWGGALLPGGKQALTGGKDSVLRLWDVATGEEVRRFKGHTGIIQGVAVSPDGKQALSCSGEDKVVRLWDIATGTQLLGLEHPDGVRCVTFAPNAKRALTGVCDGLVILWDLETGQEIRRFTGQGPKAIYVVAFTPDGRHALSAANDNTVRLWEVATGKELARIREAGEFFGLAVSHDGKYVLTSGAYSRVPKLYRLPPEVWPVEEPAGPARTLFGHKGGDKGGDGVWGVAIAPDATWAVSCGDDMSVRKWDLKTGEQVWATTFSLSNCRLRDVCLSPDGKQVLAAAYSPPAAHLLDAATGAEVRRFEGHQAGIHGVSFSPDGRFALTASGSYGPEGEQDYTARLWQVETGKEVQCFQGHTAWVRTAVYSPDGKQVLTASQDGTARLWEVKTGNELGRFKGHDSAVLSAVFSPDGRKVLTSGWDGTVRLWDVSTFHEVRRFEGHTDKVSTVVFSHDGRRALTAGEDGTVRLWEVDTGKQIVCLRGAGGRVQCAVLSEDGRFAVSGSSDGAVRLWRLPDPPAAPTK